ncbi:alpha/beta hydrolase [Streptomyces angustmyceticus]|uniref:alpha/beta hydrolase n=1 Tax=Streptomyces angustmyceticus TaxID=285578 RepID=UPI003829BA43
MSARPLAVAAVVALLAAFGGTPAAAAADVPDLTSFYQQKLSWEHCGKDLQNGATTDSAAQPPGFRGRLECARLEVPRDYRNPEQSTMQVQLIRLKATGPGKRLGSLVINPGGPGASGVNYLIDSGSAFARLGQRYDIVSFDPRGTGHTDPVSCGSKLAPSAGGADSLAAKEKRINDACGRYSGGLLRWVGTPDVARDMDVLRAAVRDDKLNYLGFSYGTKLGAVYAHEFPRKVGRMVLDSVEDPTKNTWQTALSQARGFQRALDDFAADCTRRTDCPLGTDEHKAQDQLRDWYRKLGDRPMKANGETVDETSYVYALREAMYSRSDWPQLRQALAQLGRGDASGILRLSDTGGSSAARNAAVPARRVGQDELPSQDQLSLRAIACRDTSERYDGRDYPRAERELTKASPLFGPDIAPTLLDCYSWPVAGDDASRDVAAPDAPRMLLVATTNDPATPYQGAFNMARELDNSSVVLTFRGEGHAAYTTGDPCVQRRVEDFLLDGTLPKGPVSCG